MAQLGIYIHCRWTWESGLRGEYLWRHVFGQVIQYEPGSEFDPAFVGVTAITATVLDAIEVLRIAKEEIPAVTTVMGGVHPTFCYEEILNQDRDVVDFCVLGEGEETIIELLEHLDNKKRYKLIGSFEIQGSTID